jgi:hypothetical protein
MFEQMVERFETHLFGLFRDRQAESEEHTAALLAEYSQTRSERDRLTRRQAEIEGRLHDNQVAAALLPGQVESSYLRGKSAQALRQALELDRIRRELACDRNELPRLEQALDRLGRQLRRLEEQLALARREGAGGKGR